MCKGDGKPGTSFGFKGDFVLHVSCVDGLRLFHRVLHSTRRRFASRSNSSTGPPVLFRHLSSPCRSLILVNTVLGSKGFGKFATYDKLRNSTCTTCQISVDKSAYYFPNLYYRSQDGHSFTSVKQNGGGLIYYLFHRDNDNIPLVAFPKGFKMVTGEHFTSQSDEYFRGAGYIMDLYKFCQW